jgi:hypothetical protein
MNDFFRSCRKLISALVWSVSVFAITAAGQQTNSNQPQPRISLTAEAESKEFELDSDQYRQIWSEMLLLLQKANDSYTPKVNYDFLKSFKSDTVVSLAFPSITLLNIKPRNLKIEFKFMMISIKGRFSGVIIYGKRLDAPETMFVTFNPKINRLKGILKLLPAERK